MQQINYELKLEFRQKRQQLF